MKTRTAWFVAPTSIGVISDMATGFQNAAVAAGISAKLYDAESVTQDNQGVELAVAAKAGFIVIDSIQTADVTAGLQAAAAAHIPVVSLFEAPTTAAAEAAVKSVITTPIVRQSQLEAAQALVDTHCELHVGFLYGPAFSSEVAGMNAAIAYVHKLCPTCTTTKVAYNAATLTTSTGPLAVSMAESNASLNAVILGNDGLVTPVVPALTALHRNIGVYSNVGSAATLALLNQTGSIYKANVTSGPFVPLGWFAMDQGIRLAANLPPSTTDVLGLRLLTPTHNPSDAFPNETAYAAAFKSAWQ